MRIPKGRLNGYHTQTVGGPWHGLVVYVPKEGTMVFSVGEWKGFYDGIGRWVNA